MARGYIYKANEKEKSDAILLSCPTRELIETIPLEYVCYEQFMKIG